MHRISEEKDEEEDAEREDRGLGESLPPSAHVSVLRSSPRAKAESVRQVLPLRQVTPTSGGIPSRREAWHPLSARAAVPPDGKPEYIVQDDAYNVVSQKVVQWGASGLGQATNVYTVPQQLAWFLKAPDARAVIPTPMRADLPRAGTHDFLAETFVASTSSTAVPSISASSEGPLPASSVSGIRARSPRGLSPSPLPSSPRVAGVASIPMSPLVVGSVGLQQTPLSPTAPLRERTLVGDISQQGSLQVTLGSPGLGGTTGSRGLGNINLRDPDTVVVMTAQDASVEAAGERQRSFIYDPNDTRKRSSPEGYWRQRSIPQRVSRRVSAPAGGNPEAADRQRSSSTQAGSRSETPDHRLKSSTRDPRGNQSLPVNTAALASGAREASRRGPPTPSTTARLLLDTARGLDSNSVNSAEDSVNLRNQLDKVKILTLQEIATSDGIAKEEPSRARHAVDPKEALIDQILTKSNKASPATNGIRRQVSRSVSANSRAGRKSASREYSVEVISAQQAQELTKANLAPILDSSPRNPQKERSPAMLLFSQEEDEDFLNEKASSLPRSASSISLSSDEGVIMHRLQEALELKTEKGAASTKAEAQRDTSRVATAAQGSTHAAELADVPTIAVGSFRDGNRGGARPLTDMVASSPPAITSNGVAMPSSALTLNTPRVARLSSAGACASPRTAPAAQRQVSTPGSSYRCQPIIQTLASTVSTAGTCGTPHTSCAPPQLRTQTPDWIRQSTPYQSVVGGSSVPFSRVSLGGSTWCQPLNRFA